MSLVSKAFSDIVTFSRSSNATRIGPTGRVEYAPHNLLQRSQEFDNAYWTKADATVTANTAAAPNGTITADTWESNGAGSYVYTTFTGTAAAYSFSVYAKAGTGNSIRVDLVTGGFGSGASCVFDLSAGTKGSVVHYGGSSGFTSSIESVGNGWYRCAITGTLNSGTWYCELARTNVSGSSIFFWGAQLSVGPYPLDYTPTTSAAVYGPRFDYDPVTLAARGLLIEEQRTNLQLRSVYSSGHWVIENATVTQNNISAPDGTVAGATLTENTSSNYHISYPPAMSLSASIYTGSLYIKKAGRRYAALQIYVDDANKRYTIVVDLDTGLLTTSTSVGGPTNTSYNIVAAGSGWYRVSVTCSHSSGSAGIAVGASDSATPSFSFALPTYTGNGADALHFWGAQVEAGSFATSYIPTVAASVTRSADVASVNTLSPWYSSTEGTLFAEASTLGYNPGRLVSLSDSPGSASTVQSINFETSGATRVYQVSGSLNFDFAPGSYTPNAIVKIAGRFKASNYAAAQNGGAVSTSSNAISPPTMTYMALGALTSNSFYLNGHLRRVAYYPRALTNAELQSLTA